MKKILATGAAALLTVTVLAGCGGSDSKDSSAGYCDDLQSTKTTVEALGKQDMTQESFDKLSSALGDIAAEAPTDVKANWTTLSDAVSRLSTALKDAGITFDDLQQLGQPGGPTLDASKIQALTTAAQSFSATDIASASAAINKEVKSECGFELGIGS